MMDVSKKISTTCPPSVLDAKPFFSVVIPLYNGEKYIENTIQSVLNQTFKDFEIVVIDDGSVDHSKEIVLSITDSRIHYFYQNNQGGSAARNAGIEHAMGQYIALLDADDLWHCKFLQSAAEAFRLHPEITWFAANTERLYGETNFFPQKLIRCNSFKIDVQNYFKQGYFFVCSSNVCFRKDTLKNKHFSTQLQHGEDLLFWYEYAAQYPLILIDMAPLVIYYKHPDSLTGKPITISECTVALNCFCNCPVPINTHRNIALLRVIYIFLGNIFESTDFRESILAMRKSRKYMRIDLLIYFYLLALSYKHHLVLFRKNLKRFFGRYLMETHIMR